MQLAAAGYMLDAFDPKTRKKVIDKVVKKLKMIKATHAHHFDAIAFRGVSGAIVAPAVADKLGVGLIAVRKPNDGSHSYRQVEGVCCVRYIILDDLVDSGKTVRDIVEAIRNDKDGHQRSECVGFFEWAPTRQNMDEDTYRANEERTGVPCLSRPIDGIDFNT